MNKNHLYGFDWLRTILILLGIPYHSWTILSPGFYNFVSIRDWNLSYESILWLSHLIRMQSFILIGGFFFAESISSKSFRLVLKQKFTKLMIPFLLCYIFFLPPFALMHVYIVYKNVDLAVATKSVFSLFMRGELSMIYLWFLPYFFSYFIFFKLFYPWMARLFKSPIISFLLVGAIISISFIGEKKWYDAGIGFDSNGARYLFSAWVYYAAFFLAGILMSRFEVWQQKFKELATLGLLCLAGIFIGQTFLFERINWLLVVLESFFSLSISFALFGFFKSQFKFKNGFASTFAAHSYSLYIMQYGYILVSAFTFFILGFPKHENYCLTMLIALVACNLQAFYFKVLRN